MKKKFKKTKIFVKYFLLFFFFLFWNLIVQPINLDEIWNYGFAHNIYNGLIPYKDFNMIITPLFPIIMSLPFYIFGSSLFVFHVEQAVLLIVMFYLLDSYLKEKSYLLLLFMIFPLSIAFPSYNLFLFLLFLIIVKLEDMKANDYLIGLVLACFILTKQTVGLLMLLPSLYYFKYPKKIVKRFIGCFIPIIFFIIYLLYFNSFFQFLDLCLFGLFDFVSNSKGVNIFFFFSILMIGLIFYFIKKDKYNIKNYYLLSFFSIVLPLFDLYHFQIFFIAFLFVVFLETDFKIYLNIRLFVFLLLIGLSIINLYYRIDGKVIYPNNIKYFEYRYLTGKYIQFSDSINQLIEKYDDKEIIFLSADGYYFNIINDLKIDYLDLINTGNWGYNGSEKLLNVIKKKENCVFFVDKEEIGSNKQTDQNVLRYVIENGVILEKKGNYLIYEIK